MYWDCLCCSICSDVMVLWPFSWSTVYYMISYLLSDMVMVWRPFCWGHFEMSLELHRILWVQHSSGTQRRRYRQWTDAAHHIVTMQCQWFNHLIHCSIWWWCTSWKLNLSGRLLSWCLRPVLNKELIWGGCVHISCDWAHATCTYISQLFCSISKCWLV
jgi:hypothetical protein